MKTEIKSNGQLIITPENELENYALKKWIDDFENNKEDSLVVVNFIEELK